MPTYIVFANTDDGQIASTSATYATAAAGTGSLALDNTGTILTVGQFLSGTYAVYESFLNFDTSSIPTTEHGIAAMLKLTMIANQGVVGDIATAPGNYIMALSGIAWTSPLTTAQWKTNAVTAAALNAQNQFGAQWGNQLNSQAQVWLSSGNMHNAERQVNFGGATRLVLTTTRALQGNVPGGLEYATFDSSNIGTSADPALIVVTVKRDSMRLVNNCQDQLSTGEVVSIRSDGADPAPNLTLGYYTKGTNTFNTIASFSTVGSGTSGLSEHGGNNVMGIQIDAYDNIYVVGISAIDRGTWWAQAFLKGSGLVWTAKTALTATLPTAYSVVQQLASCWVNNSNNAGFLFVQALTEYNSWWNPSANLSIDSSYAVFSCANLLAGAGPLVSSQTNLAYYGFAPQYAFDGGVRILDSVGFSSAPIANPYTCIAYASKASAAASYQLAWHALQWNQAGGGVTEQLNSVAVANSGSVALGGDSQIRTIQCDGNRVAIVFGQSSTYHSVCMVDKSGNGSIYSAMNISTMPDFSLSADWDASYDPASGNVWLYYIDINNNRRIARVAFNINTNLWSNTETQITTTLGSAGGTNSKLKTFSETANNLNLVIEAASVTAGGVWSTSAVLDSYNNPPNAPSINNIQPFDATGSKVISWVFSDPDSGDSQSAYAIEIDNNANGASAYRSGTVSSAVSSFTLPANTLSNNLTYRIRISNKDSNAGQGPFSNYSTFQTSSAGTLTIIDPVSDDIAGYISANYTVKWTFSNTGGATQTKYQIKATRLDTSTTFYDSGLITSTATQAVVPNFPSGVRVRVDLVITTSTSLTTGTASRYMTTTYAAPDQIISLLATTAANGSAVNLGWSIPTPTGSRPSPTSFDIYRSIDGGVTWTGIVNLPAGTTNYLDAVCPSQCIPQYAIRANSNTGYTWSVLATASAAVNFLGIIISQQGTRSSNQWSTAQTMYFGGAANSESIAIGATQLQFAGRAKPVTEFGDNGTQTISVSATLPFAGNPVTTLADTNQLSDYQIRVVMTTLANNRETICFRDGRGRQVFGSIQTVSFTDVAAGTKVAFTVDAVDFAEGPTTTNVTS
jgi:hypothetical protein